MTDVTATLRLQFGSEPPPETFSLETDARDSIFNRPVLIEPFFVHSYDWTDEEYEEFYRDSPAEIMKVVANGRYHLRLYSPPGWDVELRATETPTAITSAGSGLVRHLDVNYDAVQPDEIGVTILKQEDIKKQRVSLIGKPPSAQPQPPTVEFVSSREGVVLDTLTFNNQRVAHLRYNYVTKGFQVAYQSEFLDAAGNRAPRPEYREDLRCAFVSAVPVTGTLILRYPVTYRLYRVNYSAPNGSEFPEVQKAYLRGDINKFPLPPVEVRAFARGRNRVAEVAFTRDFFPSGAGLYSWQPVKKDDVGRSNRLAESGSTRVTRTLTVGDTEVDVEDKTSVVLYDARGNAHNWFFQP